MVTASQDFEKTKVNKEGQLQTDKFNQQQGNIADDRNRLSNLNSPFAKNTTVGPAAQINMAPQNEVRDNQNQLVSQLQAQANGTGPSLASNILKQGTDRNLAGQAALAASAPQGGTNPALLARGLSAQTVMANQTLAQQVAQQRMAEQINAQNQLGAVLGNQRGQDIGLATSQADLNQQALINQSNLNNNTSLANLSAGVNTNGQNIQAALGLNNLGLNAVNGQAGAVLASDAQDIQQDQWKQAQESAMALGNAAGINGMIGAGIGAVGNIATGGLSAYLTPPGATPPPVKKK